MLEIHQGDILKVERIRHPVLVVSKDYFNESMQVLACPIFSDSSKGALHIYIETEEIKGVVQCEKLALLDLKVRGYIVIGRINVDDRINIADTIQGIFDYV